MKNTIRIACTLAASAMIGSAALAQSTSTSTATATTTLTQTMSPQTAEQREKARLEAEAAKKAAAEQATVDQARKDIVRAQKQVEEAQKLAQKQTQQEVTKEIAKVQEALKQAQRELELYSRGTAALDMARYEKALEAFAEAAAMKGAKADSALYWKAFSEYKVDAQRAALESLKQMQTSFPDSRWLEQALALELEVKGAMGKPVSPAATPDEELKLIALSAYAINNEQALPMLEKMINGPQSIHLKKRALFVVSQSKSPRAREILTSVAKGASGPDLQLEAVQYLGMLGGAEDRKLLSDIYAASKDRDVKMRVVDALFIAGDARALVDKARKETDQEMRKRIVERLSRMKAKEATDYMVEIINK